MTSANNAPFNFDKPYMDLLNTLFKVCAFTMPGWLWLTLYGEDLFGVDNPQTYVTMPLFSAIFAICGMLGYALVIVLHQWILRFILKLDYWENLKEIDRIQFGNVREGAHLPIWSMEEYDNRRKRAGREYWHEYDAAFAGTATQVRRLGSLIGSSLSIVLLLISLYLRSQNILDLSMEWTTILCMSVIFIIAILAATIDQIYRVRTWPRKFAVVGIFTFLCLIFYFTATSFMSILR